MDPAISLQALTEPELEGLSASGAVAGRFAAIAEGALPPARIATRALALLRNGHAKPWCNIYFIVQEVDRQVVGGCGFKGAPVNRRVEIGYGMSPAYRNRGIVTFAVRQLLTLAFASGHVDEVLAQINPQNAASARIAAKLGFISIGAQVDEEDDLLLQWVARNPG